MYTVIIYGQMINGIKPTPKELKNFYGCENVIENWDGKQPLSRDTLAITTRHPPFNSEYGTAAIHINIAADHITRQKRHHHRRRNHRHEPGNLSDKAAQGVLTGYRKLKTFLTKPRHDDWEQ